MITVLKGEYINSHGHTPRGYGLWAFDFAKYGVMQEETVWTPTSMNYSDAIKWAKKYARQRKYVNIIVKS